jgi:hypothetical protein
MRVYMSACVCTVFLKKKIRFLMNKIKDPHIEKQQDAIKLGRCKESAPYNDVIKLLKGKPLLIMRLHVLKLVSQKTL